MRGRHVFLGPAVAVIGAPFYYCKQQVPPQLVRGDDAAFKRLRERLGA